MGNRQLNIRPSYDTVVIGGGCNGLATAWDAALRGLSVLLLEKEDFGWATSAWNSRLIHGGLKYLEKYDVRLVRESLREREWLLRAAPHLVKPLRFFLPFYKHDTYQPWFLRLGMIAYDLLSFDKSTPWHREYSRRGFLDHIPSVNTTDFCGGAAYFETQVAEPERLMNEIALSARDAGATLVNHARVDGLLPCSRGLGGVNFTDSLSGERHSVQARVVINAAGPWVDDVLATLRGGAEARLMGGTKGTHLIVDSFPGAPSEAIYFEAKSDSRPLLVIPWRGRYLLGSTDERFSGNPDTATPSDDEIDYILAETNTVIPTAGLTRDDVIWCYAGVRPLPYKEDGPTSDITRRHIVKVHGGELAGLISIIGGKLTTFRQLGEDVVDAAAAVLGRRLPPSPTRRLTLAGAQNRADGSEPVSPRLLEAYGHRAGAVQAIARRDKRLAEPVAPGLSVIAAEIVYAVEEGHAGTLGDVVARRIMTGLDDDLGLGSLRAVGSILEEFCGWSPDRVERDAHAYVAYVEKLQPRKANAV